MTRAAYKTRIARLEAALAAARQIIDAGEVTEATMLAWETARNAALRMGDGA